MEIEVKLFATLQQYLPREAGKHFFKLELEEETKVVDVLNRLNIPQAMPKILLVNGKYVQIDCVLRSGDVLSIFPPLGGG